MYQNVNDLLLLNLVIEVTYTERVVGATESGSLVCVGFSPLLLLPTGGAFSSFYPRRVSECMCGCFTEGEEKEKKGTLPAVGFKG